jgi:biopolymer transport protein ExbD
MSRYARQDEDAEIDLTPMLDVVFIMLIFFIVTASFLKESGIAISRPDSTQEPPENVTVENIVFQVTANDEIWIDNRRVDIRSVRAVIDRRFAENPEAAVVISAHKASTANTYTSIADDARAAGNYRVTLVTTEE